MENNAELSIDQKKEKLFHEAIMLIAAGVKKSKPEDEIEKDLIALNESIDFKLPMTEDELMEEVTKYCFTHYAEFYERLRYLEHEWARTCGMMTGIAQRDCLGALGERRDVFTLVIENYERLRQGVEDLLVIEVVPEKTQMTLEELNSKGLLTARIYHVLRSQGLDTLEKILNTTQANLLKPAGFGKKSLKQLIECLKAENLLPPESTLTKGFYK